MSNQHMTLSFLMGSSWNIIFRRLKPFSWLMDLRSNHKLLNQDFHCMLLGQQHLIVVPLKTVLIMVMMLWGGKYVRLKHHSQLILAKRLVIQGVNQKIIIGAVRPKLGKRALACPNVAGRSGGEGCSEPPIPQQGCYEAEPSGKILRS